MTLGNPEGDLASIAAAFDLPGRLCSLEPLGNGNVNDSYLVVCEGPPLRRFVLQRLNRRVFPRPELVMANMIAISEHVEARLNQGCALLGERRWQHPRVLLSRADQRPWVEQDGGFWRLITFIESSRSFDVVASAEQAREVGFGLGIFHHLISDLPPARLADTLEGFHVTPRYLELYDAVLASAPYAMGSDVRHCQAFVEKRRSFVPVLETARVSGQLRLRPIHGDPKVNNVMLEASSGRACALVDLDTVKPGLIHYDIGDCLRSCCNPVGEEAADLEAVHFDIDLCREVLSGYLAAASAFLTTADYDHLYAAIRLISFELGLRFFTDHLAGNVYFKTDRPDHNLQRALVQFRLTESIEAQEGRILELIADLRADFASGC
ncbi:aminoglycoside phosphotransferase family protein [Synechococcus sp. CCY 0621]|uniref:phosphotransferase enzyme family protein n=1 Tax=Synechococcus sp. CCY 0621 TaxID=2815603 RepID=UPI001C246515|nr:aminoglycoside phosphotransferase family protein [Synechococcus sp. CCY 0621]